MKTNLLAFTFLLTTLIIGCSKSNKQKTDQIIIAGKIDNYNKDSDNNLIEIIFKNIMYSQTNELIQISENGEFKHITERPFPQDFMLAYGSIINLYVSPGDSIFIEIDNRLLYANRLNLNKHDLIKISGTSSIINSDIIKYNKFFNDSVFNWSAEEKAIIESTPDQYKVYIENRTKKYNEFIQKFNFENNTSKEFQNWAKYEIEYGVLDDLMRYRWHHPLYNKLKRDSLGNYPFDIPKEYFSFLEEQKKGNRDAVISTKYYNFIQEYTMYLQHDAFPLDSLVKIKELENNNDIIGRYNIYKRQVIRNCSDFAQDLELSILYYQLVTDGLLDVYEKVSASTPIMDKSLNNILQKKYISSKSAIENPQLFDHAHLTKISSDIVKPIIDTIINNFKGDVLYIDFWAPWCGPCMFEMPYSKKIQNIFENKDVRFIYLANRCTEESWKTTIYDKQISGEHFLLTDNQFKVLSNQFNFSGIPHYLLVDKTGNIISNEAPRPSNDIELKRRILELLDK